MDGTAQILMVEDNEDEYEAARRSFRKYQVSNPIVWRKSAEDALQHLQGHQADLILLDLNMPGMGGRWFLHLVKSNPKTNCIPIVIFTTSADRNDIERCYQLGASTYIQKPVDLGGLNAAVAVMRDYWLSIALLPTKRLAN